MPMTFPQISLILVELVMMCVLMSLMVRRKLLTAYPLFFSYIAFTAMSGVLALLVLRFAIGQYFYVYWTLSTIVMMMGFAVQYEVFVDILKPFSAVLDLGKMLFFWAAGFLFIAGILTAVVTSGTHANKLVVAVSLCDRCVHLMQCGLMLLLIVFEKRLSLSWRSPGMSVALGIGVAAAMDLGVSYAESRFPAWSNDLGLAYGAVFAVILAFWIFRLSARETAPTTAATSPSKLIIQRWNDALISYRQGDLAMSGVGMNSFLPGVEQTVDRVLARKMVQ